MRNNKQYVLIQERVLIDLALPNQSKLVLESKRIDSSPYKSIKKKENVH